MMMMNAVCDVSFLDAWAGVMAGYVIRRLGAEDDAAMAAVFRAVVVEFGSEQLAQLLDSDPKV